MPLVIAANTAAEEYDIAVKNKALAIDNVRKINLIKEKYDKKELTELEAKRQILELLGIEISKNAKNKVKELYNWTKIAQDTHFSYQKAICETMAERQAKQIKNKEVKKGIHLHEKSSAKKLEEVAASKLSTAAAEKEALAKLETS